jgi:RNA polymerase sigma-70 factor (ECF subfamily)
MSDAARFEAFVREYQDMVFATAVRLLGRDADAEDVAQTVFLRAFERFAQVGASPAAAGWLKTVTTNLCLNHLSRYRARWQFFSEMEASDAPRGRTLASLSTEPHDFERQEQDARLERALRHLPDHQRVPLVLFHFEQQGCDDIARLLGVSVGKVRTDMHRGRLALRRWLS